MGTESGVPNTRNGGEAPGSPSHLPGRRPAHTLRQPRPACRREATAQPALGAKGRGRRCPDAPPLPLFPPPHLPATFSPSSPLPLLPPAPLHSPSPPLPSPSLPPPHLFSPFPFPSSSPSLLSLLLPSSSPTFSPFSPSLTLPPFLSLPSSPLLLLSPLPTPPLPSASFPSPPSLPLPTPPLPSASFSSPPVYPSPSFYPSPSPFFPSPPTSASHWLNHNPADSDFQGRPEYKSEDLLIQKKITKFDTILTKIQLVIIDSFSAILLFYVKLPIDATHLIKVNLQKVILKTKWFCILYKQLAKERGSADVYC
ncbi:uncharacterized protein LOC118523168 [Halichoerus grypus]